MLRLDISQQTDLRDDVDAKCVLSQVSVIGAGASAMDEATRAEVYDERLSDIIEGRDDAIRAHLGRAVTGTVAMGRVTAEIIAHELADPVAVLAIATILERCALILDVDDETVMGVGPQGAGDTWIAIAPGIEWRGGGRLVLRMPDTLAQAAVGRPLREILSHPVLDRHDLTIAGCDTAPDGMTTIATDDPVDALTEAELLDIRPGRAQEESHDR